MRWETMLDTAGGILIALGCVLSLIAAIGLVRLSDTLTRVHAGSKPQSFGIVLVCAGLALILREPAAVGALVLVVLFQLLTSTAAAQMIARSAFRTDQYRADLLSRDDSTPADKGEAGDNSGTPEASGEGLEAPRL